MHGEQGFKAVHKAVHLVKFIGKGCPIIFSRAYITLIPSTTGYKVLYGTYMAAQQQNKLLQFLVCANVGVLFSLEIPPQACEKRIQTRFFL